MKLNQTIYSSNIENLFKRRKKRTKRKRTIKEGFAKINMMNILIECRRVKTG